MKVEWRTGDLADLAFLRAESIDVAFSAYSVAEVDDAPRLFRQVQRVLKPNGPFVFSYEHPMALCIGPSGSVERSYFDPGPIDVERHGERVLVHAAAWATCSPNSAAPDSGSTPFSNPGPTPPAPGCRRPSCGAPAKKAPDHSVARCAAGYLRRGPSLPGERLRSASPPHHHWVVVMPVLAGPGVEPRVGVVLRDRAFVEPGFEQELERVAHDAPGLHAEVLHHLPAVERRTDGVELFLLA